jgi:hypothetical protein
MRSAMVLSSALLCAAVALAAGRPAMAEEPRRLDFAGGLVLHQPLVDGLSAIPGLGMLVRAYGGGWAWASLGLSLEPTADLRNPEQGALMTTTALDLGVGAYKDIGGRLTLYAGGRTSALYLSQSERFSWRLGPMLGAALLVGHAWGHPMSLEAQAQWSRFAQATTDDPGAEERSSAWQGGLYVTGVLLPDRPLR